MNRRAIKLSVFSGLVAISLVAGIFVSRAAMHSINAQRGLELCELVPSSDLDVLNTTRTPFVVGFRKAGADRIPEILKIKPASDRKIPEWLLDLIATYEIRKLHLEQADLSNDVAKSILESASLEQCELVDCEIEGSLNLNVSPKLKRLSFGQCRFTSHTKFSGNSIEELSLVDSGLSSDAILSLINSAKSLRRLLVTDRLTPSAFESLSRLPLLEKLVLCNQEIPAPNDSQILYRTSLTTLSLVDCFPRERLPVFIRAFPHLQRFRYADDACDKLIVDSLLSSRDSLNDVLLTIDVLKPSSVMALESFPNLRRLAIQGAKQMSVEDVEILNDMFGEKLLVNGLHKM